MNTVVNNYIDVSAGVSVCVWVCKRDNLLPQDNASFHPDSPAQYRKLLILVVPVVDICTLDDLKVFMKP